MDIVSLQVCFSKKEAREFRQQNQNLECENRSLDQNLEKPNNTRECIIDLYSFSMVQKKKNRSSYLSGFK